LFFVGLVLSHEIGSSSKLEGKKISGLRKRLPNGQIITLEQSRLLKEQNKINQLSGQKKDPLENLSNEEIETRKARRKEMQKLRRERLLAHRLKKKQQHEQQLLKIENQK
jgi:hypothetical protein